MLKIGAERPLILLDWHQTVSLQEKPSHTPEVPQRSVAVIQQFLDAGYQLDICSFTAKTKTQQAVINGVAALNQRLSGTLSLIVVCTRKVLADRTSISVHTGAKADEINAAAAVYKDDQNTILREVNALIYCVVVRLGSRCTLVHLLRCSGRTARTDLSAVETCRIRINTRPRACRATVTGATSRRFPSFALLDKAHKNFIVVKKENHRMAID